MKLIGKVLDTFSASKSSKNMPRPKVDFLNLIYDYGIENDKFAKKDLNKTVMIVGANSYTLSKDNGINIDYGTLGENIVFDFDPHELEIGAIMKIGESEIQITEKCTICQHLTIFDKRLPKVVRNHRGLYAKILKSGKIEKNLPVFIKE